MNIQIPLLGMGTWGMGGTWERDPSNVKESIEILRHGLNVGIRLIDVAEIYGDGLTEEIVGEATRSFKRGDVFIITKVWKTHLHYDDVIKSAEKSLERLQTNYIDLYLVHWPSDTVPLLETMEAMEFLVRRGIVHHIGVSNFDVPLMKEAQKCLKYAKLAANQIEYNLLKRFAEKNIIPFCKANDIQVIAYRPLAKGLLANHENAMLDALAEKYNKTKVQIILNWILSRGITVIPKTETKKHLVENYGALGWILRNDDIILIDKAFI